jgi:hypothetical protein
VWLTGPNKQVVLCIGYPDHDKQEIEVAPADEALIAAAPELLDACKGLLGLLQLVAGRSDCPPAMRDIFETNHRAVDARAAVAKAEGRS